MRQKPKVISENVTVYWLLFTVYWLLFTVYCLLISDIWLLLTYPNGEVIFPLLLS